MIDNTNETLSLVNRRNRNNGKWSFRRYLTEIWHYKWWVFGASVRMSIAGAFGLEFAYSRPRRVVSSSFCLEIPSAKVINGGLNGPTFVLYGGDSLTASDIFSLSAIQTTINENQEFSKLDAEKISKKLSFSVGGFTKEGGEFVASVPYSFSISLRSSVFASLDQAKAFVVKLTERPLLKGRSAVATYSAVTAIYDGFANLDYSEQAALIVEKANLIKETYDSLSKDFSGSHILGDGRTTLNSEYERFRFAHASGSSTDADVALGQVSSNNFLKFTNTAEGRAAKIAELKSLGASYIDNAKKTIADISTLKESYDRLASTTQIVTTETEYTETMVKLNNEISTKQVTLNNYLSSLKKIGYVSGTAKDILEVSSISEANSIRLATTLLENGGYIQHLESPDTDGWATACAAFETKINSLKSLYDADIATVNDSFRFLQSNYAGAVRFTTSAVVSESGGLDMWLGAIAGIVLGFVASSLIATFVGIWKEDKEEEKAAKTNEAK